MFSHNKSKQGIKTVHIIICVTFIQSSLEINLGLISGDSKPNFNPLVINKKSKLSPVFITIHSKPASASIPKIHLPKIPSKSLLTKNFHGIPSILQPQLTPVLPKLSLLPLPLIPSITPFPILPIPHRGFPLPYFPKPVPALPILSPISPGIPFLHAPILPTIPKPFPPYLRKEPLLLKQENKPAFIRSLEAKEKEKILEKLLKLRSAGSLTAAEFLRFKRILLK